MAINQLTNITSGSKQAQNVNEYAWSPPSPKLDQPQKNTTRKPSKIQEAMISTTDYLSIMGYKIALHTAKTGYLCPKELW